ncbi:MAG: PhoU domain-containing protein [Desulfovibrionaceae bacterium]
MLTFEGLQENFKFLDIEVQNLIKATLEFLDEPTPKRYDKIVSRDDYIDNLKNIIENKCFSRIHSDTSLDKRAIDSVRSLHISCVNLERIADFCVNVTQQIEHLSSPEVLEIYDYNQMFEEIITAANKIRPAMESQDLTAALTICRAEHLLDKLYKERFDHIMAEMRDGGKNVEDLITMLFIFRYLERIGDSLLNIGEAIIFSILGERIKIHQFQALQQTLSRTGFDGSLSDIDFQAIWGTRSGCRIGRVEHQAQGSVFKEGSLSKIHAEKENIERWSEVFPGLAPRIFSFYEDEDTGIGSMLVEFLPGCTMDENLLTTDGEVFRNAIFTLTQTVREVWETTRLPQPVPTDFMDQALARLDSVLQVHPGLYRTSKNVGVWKVESTRELLDHCRRLESGLAAPGSVFIHGDFNVNNVVYNHEAQRIHYVDVHRSRQADFVQDVSVFLVSNFRLPIFEPQMRARIEWVIDHFLDFAQDLAREWEDASFEARLAFGLARSLLTSSRFELNEEFAKDMFLRSHFLMEKLAGHGGRPWETFELPDGVLTS